MSVKNLYYYVKNLSKEDKKQSHISLSTNLNIFINDKPYNINKIFIEGPRDNFSFYVLVNNVKYYFHGVFYPLTKKHVYMWYTNKKSYYTIESPITNKSVSPIILVKDNEDPFKFLTIIRNNLGHNLRKDQSVLNFTKNNIIYFNDNITKTILRNYFILNILIFWIIIIIVILIIIFIIYFKFIRKTNIKFSKIINNEDNYYEDNE
jgi:hypothetical protein